MKTGLQPGRSVIVQNTSGSRTTHGKIVRYDLEGFYRVAIPDEATKMEREFIVHEDDMELAPSEA